MVYNINIDLIWTWNGNKLLTESFVQKKQAQKSVSHRRKKVDMCSPATVRRTGTHSPFIRRHTKCRVSSKNYSHPDKTSKGHKRDLPAPLRTDVICVRKHARPVLTSDPVFKRALSEKKSAAAALMI